RRERRRRAVAGESPRRQPVAQILLVEGKRFSAAGDHTVPGGVGRENFIDENEPSIERAKFEFRVEQKNPARSEQLIRETVEREADRFEVFRALGAKLRGHGGG